MFKPNPKFKNVQKSKMPKKPNHTTWNSCEPLTIHGKLNSKTHFVLQTIVQLALPPSYFAHVAHVLEGSLKICKTNEDNVKCYANKERF